MKEEVLEQIDILVERIYSVDKPGLDEGFAALIRGLLALVDRIPAEAVTQLNEILLQLEAAYIKKDLVELADILIYELKVLLEGKSCGLCGEK